MHEEMRTRPHDNGERQYCRRSRKTKEGDEEFVRGDDMSGAGETNRTEESDVSVVFGGAIDDEESLEELDIQSKLWVFVKVSTRRVQFLQRCDDGSGRWELTKQTGNNDMEIRKTWKSVKFNLTGSGKQARTTTAAPLPAADWETLTKNAQAFFDNRTWLR